jgi:hypothetical protein
MDKTVNWKEALEKTVEQKGYGGTVRCELCAAVNRTCHHCVCFDYSKAIECYPGKPVSDDTYCVVIYRLFWSFIVEHRLVRYSSLPAMKDQPEFIRACAQHMLEWYEEEFENDKT